MGRYNVIYGCFQFLLLATMSVLLGICQQTPTACPPQCPVNCTNQNECCPTGYYWPRSSDNDTSVNDTQSATFHCEPIPCSVEINYCQVCRFNWTSDEVVCSQCEDALEPSPSGCVPRSSQSTLSVWVLPVVVVVVVLSTSAVAAVVAVIAVRRCRRRSSRVRPPLPPPDRLDDLPFPAASIEDAAKNRRRSIIDRVHNRNRYVARTPDRPQQGATTIGGQRDRVQSVNYEKREDVLRAPASTTSPQSSTSQKPRRPAAAEPAPTQHSSTTKKATTGPAQEIYANCDPDPEDGEIYANENIELQQRAAVDVVVQTDDGEVQEEYQNVEEIGRTASQRSPSNNDDDEEEGQQIYENVSRKPTPAPKPRRPF